jgi:hypothetical protein
VIYLLKGLNDPYDTVHRHILSMDPLPTIAKVFALIQQQERQTMTNQFLDVKNASAAQSSAA